MRRLLHIAAWVIALASALCACSDNSCSENGSALPLATIYLAGNQQYIGGLTVKGIGVPGDSLLVDSGTVNQVYLPLRASATSTAYALWRTVNGVVIADTLTITYTPIEYFHSIECGAMFNYEISDLTCTTHGIDSVVPVTTLVTNATTPVMRIYFTLFQQ